MHLMHPDIHLPDAARRPTPLDLAAAGLLLATVILHVAAMVPHYYGGPGQGSAWSQPDQAALYSVLAAGWAVALGLGLTGPGRASVSAGVAVGLAATEFGFRLSDLGEVFRYGTGQASTGLWLMTAAWVVGAAGAAVAVVAVSRRARATAGEPAPGPLLAGEPVAAPATWPTAPALPAPEPALAALWGPEADDATATEPAAGFDPISANSGPADVAAGPLDATVGVPLDATVGVPLDATVAMPVDATAPFAMETTAVVPFDATAAITVNATPAVPASSSGFAYPAAPSYGAGPTMLVALLSLVTAGAFLPAWDHYVGISATTGRSVTFNLGNAFSGPWQVVIGNVFAAIALAGIPILAIRMRQRAIGAAVVAGSLIVLAAQFTSAIVSVDQPVPASVAGLSPSQLNQLGLQLHLSLTGWFTFDVLAAFALFVAAMVLGHVHELRVQASPVGTWPSAPDARRAASLPWS
jgi:hypothetical protein